MYLRFVAEELPAAGGQRVEGDAGAAGHGHVLARRVHRREAHRPVAAQVRRRYLRTAPEQKKRVHKKGHHIDDEDKQKETWMTSHCLLLSRASVEEGPVGASAPAEVKAVAAAAAAAGGAAEEELADAGPSPMLM